MTSVNKMTHTYKTRLLQGLHFSRRQLLLTISGFLSFLVFLILLGVSNILSHSQLSQQMAERWSDQGDMAQVSCFLSQDAGLSHDMIETFRHTIDSALEELSIVSDSENEDARLWADAFSESGTITVTSDRASVTVNAIGVGGDFFLFHPLQLLTGAYFSESDLNHDYIILDEEAAWQLFGSNDIVGMTVTIGGVTHVVSGVVERETGYLAEAAGLDSSTVYVSYLSLESYGSTIGISCYEIVMPNPITDYVYDYVKENLGVSTDEMEIVENTSRFSLLSRLQVLAEFGTRSMSRKAIVYPYWENMARGLEDIVALLTLLAILFLLYPIVLLLVLICILWRRKTWTVRGVAGIIKERGESQTNLLWRNWKDKAPERAGKRKERQNDKRNKRKEDKEKRKEKRMRKKQYKDRFDDEEEYYEK